VPEREGPLGSLVANDTAYTVLSHLGEGYIFDVIAGTSPRNGVPELSFHLTYYVHKGAEVLS
jgi:hypothetical protein